MKIERLILDRVACFEHLNIRFQPGRDPDKADIHILVGANGTGKTTILMALAQFFSSIPTGIEKRLRDSRSSALLRLDKGGAAGFKFASSSKPPTLATPDKTGDQGFSLAFRRNQGPFDFYETISVSPILDKYRLKSSEYRAHAPEHKDTRFDFAAFAYSGQRSTEAYRIESIKEQNASPLAQACLFEKTQLSGQPDSLIQWIANSKAKAAFARTQGHEKDFIRYNEAVERIESTISRIIGKRFAFTLSYEPLNVGGSVDGQDLEIEVLPDGLKSLISWIGDLLMRMDRVPWSDDRPVTERPFLLFLDEVEVHLHPAWQRQILPTIQSLFPHAQVFLSTHSPFVIASADDAWIYHFRMKDGRVRLDEPLPSMVGHSYSTVLRDVLGIEEEFAPQVEGRLTEFYALRDQALRGDEGALDGLKARADDLRKFGEEVLAIVVPEVRQVEKRLAHRRRESP
jgi:predicted ATP-binding protein involved in virulence